MPRILLNLIIIAIGAMVVFYLMPQNLKEKALALLSSIIPDPIEKRIEEKLEPIIYTPAERREKLIEKLETGIAKIKTTAKNVEIKNSGTLTEEIIAEIEETEKIVEKIKSANEEQGPINKVTTSIIKKAGEILNPQEKIEIQPSENVCP